MSDKIKVGVSGALGRMGKTVLQVLAEHPNTEVFAAVDRSGPQIGADINTVIGGAPTSLVFSEKHDQLCQCDVVIDFSAPEVCVQLAQLLANSAVPFVTGTTGLNESEQKQLDEASQKIALVAAANFSVGVTVAAHLSEVAARLLGDDFDAEVIEMHHRLKVDAPSGTALKLAQAVADGKRWSLKDTMICGRQGRVGKRPDAQIGVFALRGGTVVGDHTVMFAGAHERVEIAHHAEDRSIFAQGAVRAALWAVQQAPGRYDMRQVLGIES